MKDRSPLTGRLTHDSSWGRGPLTQGRLDALDAERPAPGRRSSRRCRSWCGRRAAGDRPATGPCSRGSPPARTWPGRRPCAAGTATRSPRAPRGTRRRLARRSRRTRGSGPAGSRARSGSGRPRPARCSSRSWTDSSAERPACVRSSRPVRAPSRTSAVAAMRVARGRRVVVEVLLPRDQGLVVMAGVEEPAVRGVGELVDHDPRQLQRRLDPARLAGRLVQPGQAVDQVGVVVEVGVEPGPAVLEGVEQPAVGAAASGRG